MALDAKETRRFISVLGSAGDFRETVPEGTSGAKYREYETSDKKTGSKWEMVYRSISGKIVDINLHDGDYGTNLQVTFKLEDDEVTASLGTNSPFGEDVMKKLPAVDLEQEVRFTPYSFTDEQGKNRRGMTIEQGGGKLSSFFYDAETKESKHGIPQPKGKTETYTKEKWSLYFATVRDFLVDYTTENIIPRYGHTVDTSVVKDKEDF